MVHPQAGNPDLSDHLTSLFKQVLSDVTVFSDCASGVRLRSYQRDVALAVIDSVMHQKGLSFVVMFPRQSGKNELQAAIEAYLLTALSPTQAELVKVSPTWKPQSLNAMRRLERVLERNLLCRNAWKKESGYIYRFGGARIFFFSGEPGANIVGATASTLLEVDEAQDVLPSKFDKDIAPMAASTNATRVFWGTAWTGETLLARELRAALLQEKADGIRRVFICSADQVAAEVPAYGKYVAGQVARFGRQHPMVRSQFFSEEIDGQAGLFTPVRRALMQGDHLRQPAPLAGRLYAFTLDVAGEDPLIQAGSLASTLASADLQNPKRDSTALTIFEVDLSTLSDSLLRAPRYRVVDRRLWTGLSHADLYAQILALADLWSPVYLVVDSTGVGAGLSGFLERALPGRVLPFTFNTASKSHLGWDFLSVVETGRFKDWRDPSQHWDEQDLFWKQVEACQGQVAPGPDRKLSWSVPDNARDHATGLPLHDDLLVSAALCAVLDTQPWPTGAAFSIVPRPDPLAEIDEGGF